MTSEGASGVRDACENDDQRNQVLVELLRARAAHSARLARQYRSVELAMLNFDNYDSVVAQTSEIEELWNKFSDSHNKCVSAMSNQCEVEEIEQLFQTHMSGYNEMKERISEWYNTRNESRRVERSTNDSASVTSSTLREATLKRKMAELKLKRLRERQSIQQQQRELQERLERQEVEAEIEQAQLEESVLNGSTNSSRSNTVLEATPSHPAIVDSNPQAEATLPNTQVKPHVDGLETNLHVCDNVLNVPFKTVKCENLTCEHTDSNSQGVQCKTNGLNADAKPWVSDRHQPDMFDYGNAFQKMANTIQESFNLPKPEILTFNGNPADYCKFICNFETNIESRISDCRLKLSYLIQYCQGEAKRCIEDCVVLSPEEGYARARNILLNRYGKPHLIARSHVEKLVQGHIIKPSDIQGLMNLSLEMEKCQITLSQIGFTSDIDNTENLRKIVKRLPTHLRAKWVERASSIIELGKEPDFSDLLSFVQNRARVANTMYGQDLACESKNANHGKPNKPKPPNPVRYDKVVTLTTSAQESSSVAERRVLSCVNCKEQHKLVDCEKFKLLDLDSKRAVLRKFKMCNNCLNFKHFAKYCKKPSQCEVADCNEKHHTILHSDVNKQQQQDYSSGSCAAMAGKFPFKKISLRIVPVVIGNGPSEVKTYALLDAGSDVTLCSEELVTKLGVKGEPRDFTITTVNQTSEHKRGTEFDINVRSLDGTGSVKLNRVWSVPRLPISVKSLPEQTELGQWEHLSGIKLPTINESEVGLLIGSDTPEAFWVEEERRGKRGEPYAIRSLLGWTVMGPTGITETKGKANVHFQHVQDVDISQQVQRLWTTDFPDIAADYKVGMSQEDRMALNMMKNSLTRENGHYKLGLPWREPDVSLPNNKTLAELRLRHLRRKLEADGDLSTKYQEIMTDYLKKGYAVPVKDLGKCDSAKIWYLPHHPVTNPNKPGKVRVVFDCAARYRGTSLNDQLLQGPDFMNSIIGVLMRFREEPVALVADIEAMFHQVKVCDDDRDALRFLWWPEGDMDARPTEYCMTVHLFGATSSPSCAGYSIRRTAEDNAPDFKEETVKAINRNLYVDDLLKSVPDVKQGIELSTELRDIMSRGGFRLTKWLSNSQEVLQKIPETERTNHTTNVDFDSETPIQRTLGLQWNTKADKFLFNIQMKEKPHTRRGILSLAGSLYDPLGFVAPVTLIPKLILQNVCRQQLRWDENVSETDSDRWHEWLSNLHDLSNIAIDRCLKPPGLSSSYTVELHLFSDASQTAYGAAAYTKIYDTNGMAKCTFVIGKSRLAPIKTVSIPRLELSAAVLAVKLYQIISSELDIKIDARYFWTDSMIVLGYIRNTKRRFKTFVSNRLATIHEVTKPEDWRHVPTESNPADLASRGLQPNEIMKLSFWLQGPAFLLQDKDTWPMEKHIADVSEDDSEVKLESGSYAVQSQTEPLDCLISRYSDWHKLQRTIAWLLRYKAYCLAKFTHRSDVDVKTDRHLTVDEVRRATATILSLVQKATFDPEIENITKYGHVNQSNRLAKLSPVYGDGLLRVGGRLENAEMPNDCKYPVILPSNHLVTELLLRNYHETNGHAGAQHTLTLTRQRYWIVRGLKTAKEVIGICMRCKRRQRRPQLQQMAPLPVERLTPDKPPFTYVGVDYFGPLFVKFGRGQAKRYGCLFTCLTTRAVHIEIAHSLTTDSFMCALHRFISRRGSPEKVFSDNGTNLTSGERELRESLAQWNQDRTSRNLQCKEIQWHYNPPYASHMGGIWERLVRSVKTVMKSVVKEQLLTDEALITVATESEKIINDRPITQISNGHLDPDPLSPNNILLLRPNSCIPPGVFRKEDSYCRRWWRQAQYLADIFWRRWLKEYVPALQIRQKWLRPQRNLAVNDLVLVCDETCPRGQWPLGLVLEVNKGRDGLVRSCRVKLGGSVRVRPISKLCLLEQNVL